MPLKIRPLSPELEAVAKRDLNEVPERREADVKHMRDWLKKQPHIRADPDDQTLISFLRGCKFSLERTKEKLDMYYTMRTALPEFFKDRSTKDKKIRAILELGTFFPLPGTDEKGRRVLLARFGASDPAKHKMEDMMKLNCMMTDMMIREDDQGIICGTVSVMDLTGMTLAHAAQSTPSMMKKMMVLFEEAYPIRPKGLHYIHNPAIFQTMFNLFKSFSKDKIKKRLNIMEAIHKGVSQKVSQVSTNQGYCHLLRLALTELALHGDDMESLYQHVPQDLLPEEYGGNAGTMNELHVEFMAMFDAYNAWFEADAKSGVDESKRPGKPKTQQDLFGLEGSFRQLNVD